MYTDESKIIYTVLEKRVLWQLTTKHIVRLETEENSIRTRSKGKTDCYCCMGIMKTVHKKEVLRMQLNRSNNRCEDVA